MTLIKRIMRKYYETFWLPGLVVALSFMPAILHLLVAYYSSESALEGAVVSFNICTIAYAALIMVSALFALIAMGVAVAKKRWKRGLCNAGLMLIALYTGKFVMLYIMGLIAERILDLIQ